MNAIFSRSRGRNFVAALRQKRKGSLLIVAMILCAIIGVSIVSYLNLGRTGMEISNRAFYNNGAMNLAENGLEQAVFAVNKAIADSTFTWSSAGWDTTTSSGNARQKWTDISFGQGTYGTVRAFVYDYNAGAAPRIISRSTVTVGGRSSQTIEKWIQVQLRRTSKFANGLVAKDTITFRGNNASVDSWNSDPDNNPATAAVAYSSTTRRDNGSVGSISVSVNAVAINNADIWGYASTGGALPSVGSNGTVGPFGTTAGTMDMTRVSTDFTTSFDTVALPTTGTAVSAITQATLPQTVGTVGTTTILRVPSITSNGNSTNVLTINGDVTLIVTAAAGTTAISLGGSSSINIPPGSSLKIYTDGDIDITGNGVTNGSTSGGVVTTGTAGQPINFQVWGTSTSSTAQNIAVKGNGAYSGTVYAPNGNVTMVGDADVMGSFVAKSINVTGNASFHYDESLANFGTGNPYRVSRWQELTSATDRAAVSSVVSW